MPPTTRRTNKRARTNSTAEPLTQAPPPPPIETPGESSVTEINDTSSVPIEERNNLPSAHAKVMESIAERNFIFQQNTCGYEHLFRFSKNTAPAINV